MKTMSEENLNWDKDAAELASDLLAMKIDDKGGQVDVDELIEELLKQVNENHGVDLSEDEFLEKFNMVYKCDPNTFAENSIWASETDMPELNPIDNDEEYVTVRLSDFDSY